MTSHRISIPLLAILLLSACSSTPERRPDESFRTAEAFAEVEVTEIVVMPVVDEAPQSPAQGGAEALPAVDLREMVRRYLIRRKDYAAPTAAWIDGRLDQNEQLDTDAIMTVTVDQWDTAALSRRGVVYAGASFTLESASDGSLLWRYRCDDLQIAIPGRALANRKREHVLEAARLLTETALSRLPGK